MLPPRYHLLKRLNMKAKATYEAEKNAHKLSCIYAVKARHERWMTTIRPLTAILERYERWAMRRYIRQVNAFLLVPGDVRQRRSVQKLRLQTVGRGWDDKIDQWVTAAIGEWGVEDFELVVNGSCGLTKLSLSEGSYMGLINDILRNCMQLTDFRISNTGYFRSSFCIIAPRSKVKNLQVDRCSFWKISLASLPCLETFYCRGRPTVILYGDVPRLSHVSLDYSQTEDDDRDEDSGINRTYPPSKFFGRMPPLDCLVLQFKGPQMWIEPLAVPGPFSQLKRLFIANVPENWDTFWILLLLDAAPALESFHVHFDTSSQVESGVGFCSSVDADAHQQHQYRRLKELVVAGFDGIGWQTVFVWIIMKRSPLLRRIHLLDGQVMDDGQDLRGLQIVPRRREWHECERAEVVEELTAGVRWPPEIILE
ncbi:hypothetical protein PR202_gb10671 [Eleusine coracana subsp. coracana]|uniref:At1g61320/AtMIF1 LRR domain-containing protein n=1 Tax=Eleusine coracana subsp. coracana TaxID=191504 RepID=A0AAV5EKV2_ELECO|nr:hypothetical protein PR202_gb10671 [Eleusine coracana subsp. coracana]